MTGRSAVNVSTEVSYNVEEPADQQAINDCHASVVVLREPVRTAGPACDAPERRRHEKPR
jgi:hypothetical protein